MSLQPEQAVFLLQNMLPTFENEHRITRKILDAIPADKASYKPDEISFTAFDLAWHIVSAEHFFLTGVSTGSFNTGAATKPQTMSELIDIFEDSFAKDISAVKQLDGEQLAGILDFRGVFQLPRVNYLSFANSHSIHHRGQLSMYLRPMGAEVPSMYGESYAAAQARKAAQA